MIPPSTPRHSSAHNNKRKRGDKKGIRGNNRGDKPKSRGRDKNTRGRGKGPRDTSKKGAGGIRKSIDYFLLFFCSPNAPGRTRLIGIRTLENCTSMIRCNPLITDTYPCSHYEPRKECMGIKRSKVTSFVGCRPDSHRRLFFLPLNSKGNVWKERADDITGSGAWVSQYGTIDNSLSMLNTINSH